MVREDVAGQRVSGLKGPAVDTTETLEILDLVVSEERRRWLAREFPGLTGPAVVL